MLEQMAAPPGNSYQETAFVFESRMREAKSNKEAVIVFSSITPHAGGSKKETKKQALDYLRKAPPETILLPHEITLLNNIRDYLKAEDQKYLEGKKDNFTRKDRVRLILKAKSKFLSGLSEEEQISMYKEAGYNEAEINKITGKKLLMAAVIGTAMAGGENLGRGLATANEKLVPFIDNIPPNFTMAATAASLIFYTASYIALTEVNMKLTKEHGTSGNVSVTGLYFLADKLFPNKTRDWLSRGIPIAQDTLIFSVLYPILTGSMTGEPHKAIAGSAVAGAINLTYTGAYLAANFVKGRRKQKNG